MKNPSHAQALCAVLGAAFIWSTSFVASKIALVAFPPLTLAAVRLTVATILIGLVVLLKREFVRPTWPDFLRLGAGGIFGITLYFALENKGLQLASSADAALLVGACPVITILLEALIYRLPVSGLRLVGAGLGIIGICVIIGGDLSYFGADRLKGDLLFLLSGVSWTFYNFTTRTVVSKYPLMTTNFFQTLVGTLALYPLALFETQHWSLVTLPAAISVLYLGLFCSVIALLLYTYGLRKLDSATAVGMLNSIPVFGVICSFVVLHEEVLFFDVVGGLIVILGVSLTVKR